MTNLREGMIYVLIFAAMLLVQYLLKRFGPQRQPSSPQDDLVPEIAVQEKAAPDVSPVTAASDPRFGRSASPGASPALPRRRFSRNALMGNRRDVQNAIVVATIMGPCRAFDPHEVR